MVGEGPVLKISKLADYATVIMTQFTYEPNQQALRATQISQTTHIALPTVSKLLKRLSKADLLLSKRGARGGYLLARSPTLISLAQIIAVVEGDLAVTQCCDNAEGLCEYEQQCNIRNHWRHISSALERALSSISLYDMQQRQFKKSEQIESQLIAALLDKPVLSKVTNGVYDDK